MSGWAVSRVFLLLGWIGVTLGLALMPGAHWTVGVLVGGALLLGYGIVGVDQDRPRERKDTGPQRDPKTLRITNDRNAA